MNKKMFIICALFVLISSCKNDESSLSEQGGLSEQDSLSKQNSLSKQGRRYAIKISEFSVKIKNKDANSSWKDLGTLLMQKEEGKEGLILVGLVKDAVRGGHNATFFLLEPSEINNFLKAMIKGGSFKTGMYYGYSDEESVINGIKHKEIITKIETINGSQHITFSGGKIKDSPNRTAEYAIPLEEFKKNLK
ncbi:Erp family outer-surface lipoprotein [Borreliella lusitaniae]|uniref:Erp family outer-surface lipoprotein n=1 Tax=Borreliella lusitaniae TaxID=100177 RepID=UPI003C74F3B1